VFANLDNEAAPFGDTFADLLRITEERGVDCSDSRCGLEEQWEMRCNWKVFYDNGAECYHCPSVHPSFMRTYEVGPEDYLLEKYETFVYHRSPARHLGGADARVDWEMYAAWPSWSLATGEQSGVVFAWSSVPTAVDRLTITTYACAGDDVSDEALGEELGWWRHIVNQEDRAVCEGVQRGLAGGMVRDGPLLLDSEHVIQHFQQQLRGALKGDAPVAIG
jgi:choline monooxygenase